MLLLQPVLVQFFIYFLSSIAENTRFFYICTQNIDNFMHLNSNSIFITGNGRRGLISRLVVCHAFTNNDMQVLSSVVSVGCFFGQDTLSLLLQLSQRNNKYQVGAPL